VRWLGAGLPAGVAACLLLASGCGDLLGVEPTTLEDAGLAGDAPAADARDEGPREDAPPSQVDASHDAVAPGDAAHRDAGTPADGSGARDAGASLDSTLPPGDATGPETSSPGDASPADAAPSPDTPPADTSPSPDAPPADTALDAPAGEPPLDVNDVSFLFPLPSAGQPATLLLGLGAQGNGGVLLTQAHFTQAVGGSQPLAVATTYDDWRVVSFRFDTCGLDVAGGPCVVQLRLEVQPVFASANAAASASDEALHLIYDVDPASIAAVEQGLRALKAASPAPTTGSPLGVHPGLLAQGLGGSYATAVEAFVLQVVGEPSLVRVASLLTTAHDPGAWFFAASTVDGGVYSPLTIAGTSASAIALLVGPAADAGPPSASPPPAVGTLDPVPAGTDDVELLLSASAVLGASSADYQAACDAALRLENAAFHDAFDVDCASCHMASRQLAFASRLRPFTSAGDPNAFAPPAGVTSTVAVSEVPDPPAAPPGYFTKGFGYQAGAPSFIARTVYESADIAARLNGTP